MFTVFAVFAVFAALCSALLAALTVTPTTLTPPPSPRYTKAFKAGDIKAQAALGDMYDAGLGCDRDTEEARTYYRACLAGVCLATKGGYD